MYLHFMNYKCIYLVDEFRISFLPDLFLTHTFLLRLMHLLIGLHNTFLLLRNFVGLMVVGLMLWFCPASGCWASPGVNGDVGGNLDMKLLHDDWKLSGENKSIMVSACQTTMTFCGYKDQQHVRSGYQRMAYAIYSSGRTLCNEDIYKKNTKKESWLSLQWSFPTFNGCNAWIFWRKSGSINWVAGYLKRWRHYQLIWVWLHHCGLRTHI